MATEIASALIAATVAIVASGATFVVAFARLRQQAKRDEAEIDRIRAETRKLFEETESIRRARLEEKRDEIRYLLILFERAAFEAPTNAEDPAAMFLALRQTRIELQMAGASFVADQEAGRHFRELRRILLGVETEVRRRFPEFEELVAALGPSERYGGHSIRMRRDAVDLMMGIRPQVREHLEGLRVRLFALDSELERAQRSR